MKRSGSSFRRFVTARLLAAIAFAVGIMSAFAVPALMHGATQPNSGGVSSGPADRAEQMLKRAIFVDGANDADENSLTPRTQQDGEIPSYDIPRVRPTVFDGDVRDLPYVPQKNREFREPEEPTFKAKELLSEAFGPQMIEPNIPFAPMPSTIQNFPGLSRTDTCTGGQCGAGIPPDTNGDVGPNHYIQSVNTAVGIYNKTGTLLSSFTFNSLWSTAGSGTPCDANNFGDPVVLYDSMADRWIVSDFAFAVNGSGNPIAPYYQCIAVSKSSDPVAGGWYLYPIRTDTGVSGQPPLGTLNDYPKFGIWTDCLYYSANGFLNGGSFNGVEFGSFSKTDMYSGAALTGALGFIAGSSNFALLPANLSAPASGLPPSGTLEYFVSESATAFSWDVRKFTPGTHCGGGGSMSAVTNVTQPSYSVPGSNIVPQPNDAGSLHNLDSLGDRLMQKAQYRRVGGTESLWVTHTFRTSTSGPTGSQWAQLDITGGTIAAAPAQQQFYDPADGIYRWMSSIAADKDGNVALGYSTSNGSVPNFPSIAYSGRLAGDPLNQLPQSETQLVAGNGSELNTCGGAACHRWGDYSSMSVDPSDSCTFWYTSEYYVDQTGGNSGAWNTRIGSFVFPACVAAASSPVVPAAPTGLSFSNVTVTSMTLNWTDNASNEDSYVVYESTDNVNFTFAAQTAANAISGNVTGLSPSTPYFFRVYAATNGALSTPLAGSQATAAPGNASSTAAGGLWSQTTTWTNGLVPTAGDNVTISDGATVTIDIAAVSLNLNVGTGGAPATLRFLDTSAQSLTAGQAVTIASNGTFQSAATGTVTTHVLSVGTDLTNNGVLDFSTNADTAGAGIIFTGAANNTFGGTGSITDIRTLTINKGTSIASTLELNPTNFTVQGTTVDGTPMAFLTLTNGTLKLSGTFTMSSRVFTSAAYTIPGTAGFWLNNPNFTVAGQNGSPTETGLLRITQGTFNIGTSSGNSMGFSASSTIIVEGGAVNATGRFGVASATNGFAYTQTGGVITVCTIGTSSTTLACFDLGTSLGSNINISAGTIVVQIPNSGASGPRDYRNQASGGIAGVTGGTLQLGNAASGVAKAFTLRGVLPNLVITNTSANHTATMDTTLVNYNNISLNVTINSGNTMNFGNVVFLFAGTTLTNNGTITHNGASSRFFWFGTNLAQSYTGSGTVTAPMTSFEVQDDLGVTISPASPNIAVSRVILFSGGVTNANKLTLGTGGATTGTVQIGNTTTPTNAGSFDVAPTFNLGTGGEVISYLRTTLTRTTGPEINPTRSLTTFTYDDNDATHALTMAAGDVTVTGTATLTNGRVITGANTFISGSAGTITRTNGYIDGNFRKTYAAAGNKTFEVGTVNGYSPVTVNATAGTFPADFTVKATQGPQPSVNAATSVQRYWTLTNSGLTSADLTFAYLVTDVLGTEANYKVIRVSGGTPVVFPTSTVNTGAHTATLTGASGFSDWTVGESVSPTATNGSISGTISDSNGAPMAGTTISMSGTRNRLSITDSGGHYSFDGVETNGFYNVTPSRVNYTFSPANRSFSLLGAHSEASFTASANGDHLNAIDTTEFFVRQHYLDFLNREPDPPGFIGWVNTLRNCAAGDVSCDRVHVSEMFYRSQEFQERGYFAYRFYLTAFGRKPDYVEFTPDLARVSGFLTNDQLEAAKAALIDDFMTRPAFASQYNALGNGAFVDKLMQTAGVSLSNRQTLIDSLNNRTATRAHVLRQIAESGEVYQKYYNQAFVVMEYFGYLHRDPDALYLDWIRALDANPADSRRMVDGFVNSTEYRNRFAQ